MSLFLRSLLFCCLIFCSPSLVATAGNQQSPPKLERAVQAPKTLLGQITYTVQHATLEKNVSVRMHASLLPSVELKDGGKLRSIVIDIIFKNERGVTIGSAGFHNYIKDDSSEKISFDDLHFMINVDQNNEIPDEEEFSVTLGPKNGLTWGQVADLKYDAEFTVKIVDEK